MKFCIAAVFRVLSSLGLRPVELVRVRILISACHQSSSSFSNTPVNLTDLLSLEGQFFAKGPKGPWVFSLGQLRSQVSTTFLFCFLI